MKVLLIAQGASVTLHADGPYREQAEALRAPGAVPSLGYRNVLCSVMIIVQARLYRYDGAAARSCVATGSRSRCDAAHENQWRRGLLCPGPRRLRRAGAHGPAACHVGEPHTHSVNKSMTLRQEAYSAAPAGPHECKSRSIKFGSPGANGRLHLMAKAQRPACSVAF